MHKPPLAEFLIVHAGTSHKMLCEVEYKGFHCHMLHYVVHYPLDAKSNCGAAYVSWSYLMIQDADCATDSRSLANSIYMLAWTRSLDQMDAILAEWRVIWPSKY